LATKTENLKVNFYVKLEKTGLTIKHFNGSILCFDISVFLREVWKSCGINVAKKGGPDVKIMSLTILSLTQWSDFFCPFFFLRKPFKTWRKSKSKPLQKCILFKQVADRLVVIWCIYYILLVLRVVGFNPCCQNRNKPFLKLSITTNNEFSSTVNKKEFTWRWQGIDVLNRIFSLKWKSWWVLLMKTIS